MKKGNGRMGVQGRETAGFERAFSAHAS